MSILLHPPARVRFEGNPDVDARRAIEQTVLSAVLRALDRAAVADERVPGRRPGEEAAEDFDPRRVRLDRGTYQLPSFGEEGQPTEANLLEVLPNAIDVYGILDGPSLVDGRLVLMLHGNRYVYLRGPRYAVAGSLSLAYHLGLSIFGTDSFAILQGPWEGRLTQYLAVGTDPAVVSADLGRMGKVVDQERESDADSEPVQVVIGGEPVVGWTTRLERMFKTDLGTYLTRGFVTKDRQIRWPTILMAREWQAQLHVEQREGVTAPPPSEVRGLVFGSVDSLVAEAEGGDSSAVQAAAVELSRLDAYAFRQVDWQTKVRYIKVLLAAWTWQEQEIAVVQIFKSLRSASEVDAVVAMLREAGRYNQLFDDLDSELYELLTTVGEQFPRDTGSLTFGELLRLFVSMHLIEQLSTLAVLPTGIIETSSGTIVPERLLDEANDAVMGFVRFGADLGESIATIFTEPEKVVEGIGGLVQLVVKVELAEMGYPPAILEINQLLASMAEKVLAGVRGADRLGCGEKVTRRIKWRLVWEIASLFVGVGEVKASIQAAGISEKLAGVLRFLRIVARLGEAAEEGVEGVRLARLAAMLKAERAAFASAGEVAELLARLPERDVKKLGGLLSHVEIKEGETLAELAARNPELHAVVEDASAKAEILKSLAAKGDGLSESCVEAFQRLVGQDGVDVASAKHVVNALGDGQGPRFATVLKRVPLERIAADGRAALVELISSSPRRMDAIGRLGYDTFSALYRRALGRSEALDRYLGALEELERQFGQHGDPAGFRRLVDRLERDDPAAWLDLENARALQAGEASIAAWNDLVKNSPKAQRGLNRLLARNQRSMVERLIRDLAGELSEEVVLALEKIDELTERELDGLLELKRYVERGGNYPQWDELLFTEPTRRRDLLTAIADLRDPANPSALVVQSGLDQALEAALYHRNVQGGLGHFETARSLLRDFPGAQFRFEVTRLNEGWREVDIVVEIAGREVDVEVKGYQASTGIDHVRRQISKDLLRHAADPGGPWTDLLWRFADPSYAVNFPTVERIFLEELERLGQQGRLPMPLSQAQTALRGRFAAGPPWKLIDVLH